MGDLYKFFSKGTHPNRELIAERFLGDGNEFVLGSIGVPELVFVIDQCMYLVDMWFWFGALTAVVAREELAKTDPSFGREYLATATQAAEIKKWLGQSFDKLLQERQADPRAQGHQ